MAPGGTGGDPEPLCWDEPTPGRCCKPASSVYDLPLLDSSQTRRGEVASQGVSDRRDSPEWELMMGCDLISLGGSSSIIGNAKDCCVFLFCLVTARKPWVVDGGKFPL